MRATSMGGHSVASVVVASVVASGLGTALFAGGAHADGEAAPPASASASANPPSASAPSASAASSSAPASSAPASAPSSAAKADGPPVAPGGGEDAKELGTRKGPWYGWQSLLASVAITGGAFAAYRQLDAEKRMPVMISAITLQIAVAPFIHLAHGNHAAVGRSIALQTALVAGGALLGAYAVQGLAGCPGPQSPCERFDATDFAALGALVGAIVAPAIDAGWLGFEPSRAPATSGSLAPTFGLTGRAAGGGPGGLSFGVVGLF